MTSSVAELSRNEQLIALRARGLSYRSLSKVFGISEGRCCQIVRGEALRNIKRDRLRRLREWEDRRDNVIAIEVRGAEG